jgi:hypothetical protein
MCGSTCAGSYGLPRSTTHYRYVKSKNYVSPAFLVYWYTLRKLANLHHPLQNTLSPKWFWDVACGFPAHLGARTVRQRGICKLNQQPTKIVPLHSLRACQAHAIIGKLKSHRLHDSPLAQIKMQDTIVFNVTYVCNENYVHSTLNCSTTYIHVIELFSWKIEPRMKPRPWLTWRIRAGLALAARLHSYRHLHSRPSFFRSTRYVPTSRLPRVILYNIKQTLPAPPAHLSNPLLEPR